jgi:hypothetical protein
MLQSTCTRDGDGDPNGPVYNGAFGGLGHRGAQYRRHPPLLVPLAGLADHQVRLAASAASGVHFHVGVVVGRVR